MKVVDTLTGREWVNKTGDQIGDKNQTLQLPGDDKMTSEINTNSDAYNTGFEAAKQGEPRTANPYANGTWDSDNWTAGWDEASVTKP